MIITGKHIRAARAVCGLSIRELASVSGVGAKSIWGFENGSDVRYMTLRSLIEVFDELDIEFMDKGVKWK